MDVMKLVEAMKRLRVIEKRMEENCRHIAQYASIIDTEKPSFETEEKQKQEVKAYIQSNHDLMKEYLVLKTAIEKTNLDTKVNINGVEYTLSELLVIKRKLAKLMMNTFESLTDREGMRRLQLYPKNFEGKTPQVKKMYDEKDKNENLREWMDLYDNIDSRLEVINATINLL